MWTVPLSLAQHIHSSEELKLMQYIIAWSAPLISTTSCILLISDQCPLGAGIRHHGPLLVDWQAHQLILVRIDTTMRAHLTQY